MASPPTTSADAGDTVDPARGLTAAEVERRTAAGQANAYTAETSRSAASIIRANVFTLFNGIVFACFGVLFVLGRWQDALFGFSAIANARSAAGSGPWTCTCRPTIASPPSSSTRPRAVATR